MELDGAGLSAVAAYHQLVQAAYGGSYRVAVQLHRHVEDRSPPVQAEWRCVRPATAQIQPNALATIYLPWVPELKGPQCDECGAATPLSNTVSSPGGAYHLTTTFPVTVYQFSALEYVGQGGPPGKDWSSWAAAGIGAYIAVTAVEDNTNVTLHLSATAQLQGGTTTFSLNAGDVMEVLGTPSSDFSGTWVEASHPIQVIHGMPCVDIPDSAGYCDHIEESVFPAETLGQHYLVVSPAGPLFDTPGHLVRLYGNVDGTAPNTISAGQVVDLGQVNQDFEVQGSAAFAVGTFMYGSAIVDPNTPPPDQKGDPSQSLVTAVEQYRLKYIFLAPTDYDVNIADVTVPDGASVLIDGALVGGAPVPIGGSGYGVLRIPLNAGQAGAHVLEASAPVGLQVEGPGSGSRSAGRSAGRPARTRAATTACRSAGPRRSNWTAPAAAERPAGAAAAAAAGLAAGRKAAPVVAAGSQDEVAAPAAESSMSTRSG